MSESTPTTNNTIKDVYDRIAQERDDGGCCPGDDGGEKSGFQPSYEDVEGHVPEADLGLGCGIPLDENTLDGGETVLDLGSGAGNDCFVARRDVGPEGKVIGVDFSEEMLEKARRNTHDLGYNNVEFRHGTISDLPVGDESVDVVISNCVLNLVPDKQQAFREIKRVLKPSGYFSVSDVVLDEPLPETLRENQRLEAGCIASALLQEDYLGIIQDVGFDDVKIVEERSLIVSEDVLEDFAISGPDELDIANIDPADIQARSITVRGYRPRE